MPAFSIVIPAHNEAARITSTLSAYARVFADSEIIVVLDGCSDATPYYTRQAAARYSNIRVMALEGSTGKGAAVVAGMLSAASPFIGFVDADGSTAADEMRRLCDRVDASDGVIGSRWLPGAAVSVPQPWLRRRASRAFNLIVRALFGLRFVDTQCGAKIFRADALLPLLHHVETANFAFDVDLLYLLRRAGRIVAEVPIAWNNHSGSRVRVIPAAWTMMVALIRLRLVHSPLRGMLPAFDQVFRTKALRMAGVRASAGDGGQ